MDLGGVTPVVWGEGRALDALRNERTGDLFIATTTGLVVHTADGQQRRLIDALSPAPGTLAVSASANRVAIAATDGSVHTWDATTFEPVLDTPPEGPVSGLGFDPDGRLSVVRQTAITAYDLAGTGTVVAESVEPFGLPASEAGWVAAPVTTGPAPHIVLAAPDATVRRIDLEVEGGLDFTGLRLTQGGGRLIATWWAFEPSDTISVWDTSTGALIHTLKVPFSVDPHQVVLTADDELLIGAGNAVTSADGSATLATIPNGHAIDQIWILDDGGLLIGDTAGGVWRSEPSGEATELDVSGVRNVSRRFGTAANELVGVDANGRIRLVDVAANDSEAISEYELGSVSGVEFIGETADIAVTRSTGRADIITDSGAEPLFAQDGPIAGLATAAQGDLVALGTTAQLGEEAWDDSVTIVTRAGDRVAAVGGEGESVPGCVSFRSRIEFSPDGTFIVANSHDFTVQVTHVRTDTRTTLEAALGPVFDVAISPDASRLVASSEDAKLRIWSEPGSDPELINAFDSPAGGYRVLAFSPDGEEIAASDITGSVVLLDASSGEAITHLDGVKARDADLVFTPDGKYLMSGAETGEIIVWSIAGGGIVSRMPGHTAPVTDIAVRADGRAVASGSDDGTVRVWPLTVD